MKDRRQGKEDERNGGKEGVIRVGQRKGKSTANAGQPSPYPPSKRPEDRS